MVEPMPCDIAASFKNIGISSTHPAKQILSNVSGYIVKGGITAILGPSAAGKSLFMRVLSGRVHNLKVTGDFHIDGNRVDYRDISNSISFVPQEDVLIGELTPRETLYNSAAMKRAKSTSELNEDVAHLLEVLGLTEVADNTIGTTFVRGISGGQKKRVDIGTELVAAPKLLFLDEPTSGLDASIAFDVLKSIYDIARASNGKLSILLSIHQPNSRLLELIDHIIVLGDGSMNFFGTVPESVAHLRSIGFPPPDDYTPTDYFLQVSDKKFAGHSELNFAGSFSSSQLNLNLMTFLTDVVQDSNRRINKDADCISPFDESQYGDLLVASENGIIIDYARYVNFDGEKTTFWRQYSTLVRRDLMIAMRDPSLYYMQFSLVLVSGLLVGSAYYKAMDNPNKTLFNVSSGLLWVLFLMAYIPIFKVYHLSRGSLRFKHERANNTYTVLAAFAAELTTTPIGLICFIPGTMISYFMFGAPSSDYAFYMFVCWLTAVTSESILNFITRAFSSTSTAVLLCQATLVIFTSFGGGVFITWNRTPYYWRWLQEISVFTQASRAIISNINDRMVYRCPILLPWPLNVCAPIGFVVDCDIAPQKPNEPFCLVSGRGMLHGIQGTSETDSPWVAFGYLFLIFVVARLGVLLLMYYPSDRISAAVRAFFSTGVQDQIIQVQQRNRCIEEQLASMTEQLHRELNTTPHLSPEALKTQASISRDIDHYENYNVDDLFEEDFRPPPRPVTAEAVEHPYCLVWKNLSLTLNKCGSLLVDNVSGAVCAGRVLALMGPSGAGKTTLLNALGNRAPYGTVTGEITFGRRDFGPGDLYYVPQFDEVNGTLTVYEQIELVGLLKCSDREDMTRRLGIILLALGLRHKVKMLCRDLSNGELKKVSVGMGMICNPKVLFLDEPTTGLDSTAAYSIVKHLTDLSKRLNIAVIMTIHQPAEMVFDMLQDLYILEAGRLAYSGPLSCSEKYFKALGYLCPGKTAVADFFMDAVNKPPTILLQSSWQTLYLSSKFSKNVTQEQMSLDVASPTAPAATPPPSNFAQLRTLVFFFLRYYYREFGFHYARLLCVIVIAFYSGTLFLRLKPEVQNVIMYSGAIFFNTWSVLFSTLAATNLMTRDRRQAVEQIKNAVISPGMYCTAQLIASLPFNFVTALVFQSVFHWLTNISTHKSSFFYAIMTAFGHLLLMEGFMLVIVEVLKNALLCITVAMLVMGWLFLFAGFFVKVPDMPFWLRWVCYLTPTKYSFDGYLYMVFHTQMFQIQGTPISRTGDFLLSSVYMQTGVKPWNMFGVLLGWIALIRFIHFATMKYQVRHFQPKRIKMSGYLEEYEYE